MKLENTGLIGRTKVQKATYCVFASMTKHLRNQLKAGTLWFVGEQGMLILSKSLVQDHLGWLVLGLQHHRRSMRKAASQCLGRKEGEGERNGWKEKERNLPL